MSANPWLVAPARPMSFCHVAGGMYASCPRLRFRPRTVTAFAFSRQWCEISPWPFAQLKAATSVRSAMFW